MTHKKILSVDDFEEMVIEYEKGGASLSDAIITICEKNNIEIESIKGLISQDLKFRLEQEMMNLNLIEKHGVLPLDLV